METGGNPEAVLWTMLFAICPAWLFGSVPGAHAELQICPDRQGLRALKMLVWADGSLVGAVAVCSLPWSVHMPSASP